MSSMSVGKRFLHCYSLALFGLLAGCAGYTTTPTLFKSMPEAWSRTLPEATIVDPALNSQSWWHTFKDPILNDLVSKAVADNIELQEAKERILHARIIVGNIDPAFLPELHARGQSVQAANGIDSFFQYGFDATWELGLFGRREGEERIASAHLQAADSSAQSIRVSVVAEVVRAYIELRTAQAQLALLEKMQTLGLKKIDLVEKRVSLGLSSTDEVSRLRIILNQEMVGLPLRRQDIEKAAIRLALLLGQTKPDAQWFVNSTQPTLSAFSISTMPVELLHTRPEIRSAEAAVWEAGGALGVAKADLYPYVSLGSSYYFSENVTRNLSADGDLHSSPALAPIIDIPLFDWGRRRAVVKAHQSLLDAAVLHYQQTVLEGIAEVESALSTLNAQYLRLQQNQQLIESEKISLNNHQVLIGLGLSSPLQALEDEHQVLQEQLELAEVQAGHDLAFVALYKALGGAPMPIIPHVDGRPL